MKNNLDERQEQKLLGIEHHGCWFAFWALLISMFVQQMVFGIGEWKYIAGESVVFLCLALYICISCIKEGIWDRTLKPNGKTNFFVCLIASIAFALINAVVNYCNFHSLEGAIWTFVVMAIFLFIFTMVVMSLVMLLFKKRVRSMEEDFNEEMEGK